MIQDREAHMNIIGIYIFESGLQYFSSIKKSKRVHTSSTQKSIPSTNFLGVLGVLFELENCNLFCTLFCF
jgi:hypothetical protein